MLPSRFTEDNLLANCGACEYLSSDLRRAHYMLSDDGCSDIEGSLFEGIADIFLSMKLMVFM